MASRTHFGVVDTAIKSMKTVEEYIDVGMETTIDVAMDFVENDKENERQTDEFKSIMLDYVRMKRDLRQFMEAVDLVKQEASHSRDKINMNEMLNQKLEEIKQTNGQEDLSQHEKYTELDEKIQEIRNPDSSPQPSTSQVLNPDEDLVMTQQELNTRCPYTGQEMKNPVRNNVCGHTYDKEGILNHLKQRGQRAKCPVAGCGSTKVMEQADLVEDKELRKYIEKKNRQAGKRQKRPQEEVE